jgi:outer membrane protein
MQMLNVFVIGINVKAIMQITSLMLILMAGAQAGAQTTAVGNYDPLSVHGLAPKSMLGDIDATAICDFSGRSGLALSLADVVDRALCNNPQTFAAWANARAQAAQVGIARSAYLPTISGTGTATINESNGGVRSTAGQLSGSNRYTQESAALILGYLLYDFGARKATLESSLQTLTALNYTQDAIVQTVFLKAEQAYYQLFATQAAVTSSKQAELSSLESLKAATGRLDAGAGTPADKLQAQTAYSQAVLNRIQAEGNTKIAQGNLANVMGLDAHLPLNVATPEIRQPDAAFERDLGGLIEQARNRRPDLVAAEAQVKAARANIDAAKSVGLPTLSLASGFNYTNSNSFDPYHTSTLGVVISIPLFTGFNHTYQVQSAQAKLENQIAARNSVHLQIALDVWQAYQTLDTATQAVHSSADLVASATESERVALGRYKAGAGTIIDVLNAQSALANARLQNIQALYSWYISKVTLAQALGQLDLTELSVLQRKP